MKYLPQIEGVFKPLGIIFFGSLAMGLWNANQHGELKDWDMLGEALYDGSFTAFMAVVAWLALRSPLSQSAIAEKAVTTAVEAVGTRAADAAASTAQTMQDGTTEAVVEKLAQMPPVEPKQ